MIVPFVNQTGGAGMTTLAFYLAGKRPRHTIHPTQKRSVSAMRGRIKPVALQGAVIVTNILRELLAREFTKDPGVQRHG